MVPINTTPDDNGNNSGFNPILTRPTLAPCSSSKDPCEQLKKLKTNSTFVSKMNILKNNIDGTKEKGFLLRDIPDHETSDIVEGDDNGNITYPYESQTEEENYKTYGSAHNHLKNNSKHIGIFTPEDMGNLLLNGMIETAPNNPYKTQTSEKAICFVITSKGLFAVKIKDIGKLNTFYQLYDSMDDVPRKFYLENIFQNPKKYNIRPTATHDEQLVGFLRFMQDMDLGIELYEGNPSTFGDWKKVTLKNNNNETFSFEQTPCN